MDDQQPTKGHWGEDINEEEEQDERIYSMDDLKFLNDWADAIEASQKEDEKEETPYLSTYEKEFLSKFPDTFAYEFSEEEKAFLDQNGYLVVKNLVSKELVDRMVTELFERAEKLNGIKRDDHKTWNPLIADDGFFDIWHNPCYYELRQMPKLYSIFAQLMRNPHLIVSLDRVCLKPPAYVTVDGKKITFPTQEFHIHNDMNLWHLGEISYQGGLALNDCDVGAGGFRCIPGFHKLDKIRAYRERYELGKFPQFTGPMRPPIGSFVYFQDFDMIKKEVKEIPVKAGDFIIWSSRLPHANSINTTDNWRLQCFIRYVPDNETYEPYKKNVMKSMLTGKKPAYYSTGLTHTGSRHENWEKDLHAPPKLTPLGQKLHGLVPWNDNDEDEEEPH